MDSSKNSSVRTGHEYSNAQAAVDYGVRQLQLEPAVNSEDVEEALEYITFGARYRVAILALVDAAEALLAYSSTRAEDSQADYNEAVSALANAQAAAKEQAGKKPIIDRRKHVDRIIEKAEKEEKEDKVRLKSI